MGHDIILISIQENSNSSFHILWIFLKEHGTFLPFYFSTNFKKTISRVIEYDPSCAGSRSRKSKVGRLL